MRKRVMLIAVLLVSGGAVVNVAVAWGFAMAHPFFISVSFSGMYEPTDEPTWSIMTLHERGAMMIHAQAEDKWRPARKSNVIAPKWSWSIRPPTHDEAASRLVVEEKAYGWPSLSVLTRAAGPWGANFAPPRWGIRIRWPSEYPLQTGYRILPLQPIWPGFAINTIFYAAILWALFFVPGGVRRMIRRRRGLCPACAYPVGTSPVCTECGKPVIPPR